MRKKFLLICLCSNFALLHAQSIPEWGSWWQQPIAREYGGEARDPAQPLTADEQIQESGIEDLLQGRSEDKRYENERELNDAIQQRRVTTKLQQRISDALIEQGYEEENLDQKNVDDLIEQRQYDPVYEGP